MPVSLVRSRLNLCALTLLTLVVALTGAPLWTVLVLALTCLAIPLAVGLHGGAALVRALLRAPTAPTAHSDPQGPDPAPGGPGRREPEPWHRKEEPV